MPDATVERSASPRLQGAYASGTVTHGHWVCWSTDQDFSRQTWYAEKSLATGADDWANGAYLFAGVVMERTQKQSSEADNSIPDGDTITIITDGYAPKAYVKTRIGIGSGYGLEFGGGTGIARDGSQPGVVAQPFLIGTLLELLSVPGESVRRKVLVRDFR